MSNIYDVVIVGAGAAGIGAARQLAESGLSSIILEASERAGGRAWTNNYVGVGPLDLGCGWLHSADRNDWAVLAQEAGAPIDRAKPAWGSQHRDLGFPPSDRLLAKQILRAWKAVMFDEAPISDSALDAARLVEGIDRWML